MKKAPGIFGSHLKRLKGYFSKNTESMPPTMVGSVEPQTSDFGQATQVEHGIALHQQGKLSEAQAIYRTILLSSPDRADVLHLLGISNYQLGKYQESVELIDRAIKIDPTQAAPYSNIGLALHRLGRLEEALSSYDRALAIVPDFAEALYNRGIVLRDAGNPEEALASYNRALVLKPDYLDVLNDRGVVLAVLRRFEDALASYGRALALKPDFLEALYNRGTLLRDLGRREEALTNFDYALAIKPDYLEAINNRAIVLRDLGRYEEALACYDRALGIDPRSTRILNNRGDALQSLGRHKEALSCFDKTIELEPANADAYYNRGIALANLNRIAEALNSYDRALAIRPDYVEALNNRGIVLMEMRRREEAVTSYDLALKVKPDFVEVLNNRGTALKELQRMEEAIASYARALKIRPDFDFLQGALLHTKMHACDWSNVGNEFSSLFSAINDGKKVVTPFPVAALTDSLVYQRKAAEIWVREKYPSSNRFPAIAKYSGHKKIRLGYFSADFRSHPVSILTAGLFEMHDRARFEVYAFSFGPNTKDDMRERLEKGFDRFIDVKPALDHEVVELARSTEIDIAIDLGGFTEGGRTGIFAARAAPVQASYIGYLGTMGAPFIDYLIGDQMLVPENHQEYYAEKIVYLPNSFQANDTKRQISDRVFVRKELGLPEQGFVFCCFNNNFKIVPETFDCWMRILKRVKGSALWLFASNASAAANLRKEAEARGVDGARLVFAQRASLAEYLAKYRMADLFLDTLPYNAGATASDALWAGLPVLTCVGNAFAGRMGASLLHAIHLPELVTDSWEEYEALAVELANNPDQIGKIRLKLNQNRLTAPLFDTALFTKHIENAYVQMYERYQAGLPSQHIYV